MAIRRLKFQAIGTRWVIEVQAALTDQFWTQIQNQIHNRIEAFDASYSRFRDDSLVAEMAKASGSYQLPDDAYVLLHFYEKLYKSTSGSVTPLIGQVIADAGYDADYSFKPKNLELPPAWEDVITYSKKQITLSQPALLDFGSAGKGYLVDIIGELLQQNGINDYLINAGGDILYRTISDTMLPIGLENPFDASEVVGVAEIRNQSLCASSGSRRKWDKYHHIIDPQSLESPQDIVATWVVADDAITADGLATALFFTSPAELHKHFTFSYAILDKDMELEYARNFPAKVFKKQLHENHRRTTQ